MRTGKMTVLVLGSGGREHALHWALKRSRHVGRVLVAPGNGGIPKEDRRRYDDFHDLAKLCWNESVDLVVIGPETPLAEGVVDALSQAGIAAFGPTQAAACLESSKVFMKAFCMVHHIPTAPYRVFNDYERAREYIFGLKTPPVVKADGLAGGKGVVVAGSIGEAIDAAHAMLVKGRFGAAGKVIIVEDRLQGRECSVMALCDAVNAVLLPPARDYKRAYDGDKGPNTGGMGAISPPPDVTSDILAQVKQDILLPTLKGMYTRNAPFHGVLYAGIMLTETGPQLLEFNVRFGDPETQVVLPRIESDIVPYLLACLTEGGLANLPPLIVRPEPSVGITLAMEGYPGNYQTGVPFHDRRTAGGAPLFLAGVDEKDGQRVTTGGRVATVVGMAATFKEAREYAYAEESRIIFKEKFNRTDIAAGL